jgi:hypothetical protein
VVREIAWRDVFPWLIILRTFALAKSMPVLFLATLGVLAMPLGWRAAEGLFLDQQAVASDPDLSHIVYQNRSWPGQPGNLPVPNDGRFPSSLWEVLGTGPDSVQPVFLRFVRPLTLLIDARLPVTQAAYFAFGLLWMLLVWSLFGGAIARIAAVRLGREERIGLGEAVRHAVRKLGASVASPLFPLLGVALVALPIVLVGFLMRWDWGVLLAGGLWVFVLLGGLIIAILLLGLLFGWPLMWGTIASEENGDAFEAFSRSYSYTFQRPLHYLFYAFLATVFGGLSWLLVYHFAEWVVAFSQWPAALGAGAERWTEIAIDGSSGRGTSTLVILGARLCQLGAGLVRTVATGFAYSLFWCLATAVYLLLRQDVDQTEFDEVYVENEDRRYNLPALDTGDAEPRPAGESRSPQPPAGDRNPHPPDPGSTGDAPDQQGATQG